MQKPALRSGFSTPAGGVMGIKLNNYVRYFICFIFGGVVFGYATFHLYAKFIGKFMSHNTYVSQSVSGQQSLKIIENIKKGDFDKAIHDLEFNISIAKITLADCEDCFEREKQAYELLSKYKFTEFVEPTNP